MNEKDSLSCFFFYSTRHRMRSYAESTKVLKFSEHCEVKEVESQSAFIFLCFLAACQSFLSQTSKKKKKKELSLLFSSLSLSICF